MNIFYMVMAFVRPVIFIAAVIGFTILMLKIARNNSKRRSEAINQLIDIAVKKLDDGDKVISNDNITNSAEARPKLTMPKERNIQELVIPEDFMFKEEFEILKYMATKYPDECRIFLYEPVSITTISLCEQRMGVKFTDELKALYTFTNGKASDVQFEKGQRIYVHGKGDKYRAIPITPETEKILKKYISAFDIKSDDLLFTNKQGQALTRQGVGYILKKYAVKSKNENPTDFEGSVKYVGRTLIIDAKYYGKQMQSQFDVSSFRSGNLYQIFTYVKNLDKDNTGNVAGMLLYAKTSEEFQPSNDFKMGGNKISVGSLDLNLPFSDISERLEKIASDYFAISV